MLTASFINIKYSVTNEQNIRSQLHSVQSVCMSVLLLAMSKLKMVASFGNWLVISRIKISKAFHMCLELVADTITCYPSISKFYLKIEMKMIPSFRYELHKCFK